VRVRAVPVLVTVSASVRGLVSVLACESVLGVRRSVRKLVSVLEPESGSG